MKAIVYFHRASNTERVIIVHDEYADDMMDLLEDIGNEPSHLLDVTSAPSDRIGLVLP